MLEKKENKNNSRFDGLIWVQNGKVFVKNENNGGMPPVINPCGGVKLYINKIEYNHLTTVSDTDVIKLKPLDSKFDQKFDVEITEDKMQCYLIYTPARLVRYVVEDTQPDNRLDIKASQVILQALETDPQQILDYLKSVHIIYGVKMNILAEICRNNKSGRFLIAEGQNPGDAIDDRIEYFFDINDQQGYNPKIDASGNIDYKNILQYNTVSRGRTIAKFYKGKPGKKGIAVTGETIMPQMPKELVVIPTFSVIYNVETGEIKAAKTGRPFLQKKEDSVAFYIYDCVLLNEVSMQTGNIRFKGDIEVKTNVYESMEIIALQNILVRGNVNFASIYAGNNITIKGTAISSRINAALNNAVIKDPAPLIEKLYDGINKLILNINQFPVKSMKNKQINYLLLSLLNTKNKDLPALIYEVMQSLRKGNYDIEDEFILTLIKKTRFLMGNFSAIPDVEYLYQLITDLKTLASENKSAGTKGDIILNSITNCDISALGNITILGKGCVNSNIYCKGKVEVKGYVRGGKIIAEKGIDVNVAGSKRGSKILLSVPSDGYINIRSAYLYTTIKVGNLCHTFYKNKNMVRARLENGKLLF